MVYGTTIKLPGEFLGQPAPISRDIEPFVTNLQETMRKLKPVPVDHKSHQSVFVHKDLSTSTHAFVRIDRVKKPLEPAYDGPFKILARQEKFFTLLIKQKEVNISLDRLKPAFLLTLPEDPEVRAPATPDSADRVTSQKASNQPTQRQTRSGRVVKFPSRFVAHIKTF
ncbi:multicellular organismal development [Nesidiocoris tenuis]|nr:multicellular organismal development [Nesidiocoris tenuis]